MAAVNTWESSASATHSSVSNQLPAEVVECLKHARFLHLATCTANRPHVSLMNYTYLPAHSLSNSPFAAGPTIIMTTNPSSKKTLNLTQNPNVSLLVHDWVSSRPPASSSSNRERSPVGGARSSSLANMLMQMNSAAVSSISVTINGEATVLEPGTPEEKWCKEQHLANNTFEASQSADAVQNLFGSSPEQSRTSGDGGRGSYIEDEEVRVVVVKIKDGRISDWKGSVKDWIIAESVTEQPHINGVSEAA